MIDRIAQIASPPVLNHAWNLVRKDKARWTPDLAMQEVERNLPLHIGRLAEELLDGRYRPQPMRCFRIPKASGGERLICAPTVRDKLAQRAVLTVLEPLGEAVFHPASFGYRPLCTLDMALARIREWIRQGWHWLGDADIARCFDTIPHAPLLDQVDALCHDPRVADLVHLWLHAADPRSRPGGTGVGLPQGLVIAPFLCNLYLHEMDMDLEESGIPFVRYADDFMVLGESEPFARSALALAEDSLTRLGLRLNLDKTRIVETSNRLRFLGKRLPNVPREVAGWA